MPRAERRPPEALIEEKAKDFLSFIHRRLTGEYEVDEFGFDKELTHNLLQPIASLLYRKWWRVSTIGIENVPAAGPAMIVANHSGTLPWDGVMLQAAVSAEHPSNRDVRLVAANMVFQSPYLAHLARKSGTVVAHPDDTLRLLDSGELVGVFPEGYKGVGKGFKARYKLQRFGRGGFMEMAIRRGVPVIPTAIVGAEEIYPMVANIKPLARLIGAPYFPVTPFFPALGPLGMIPLPTKWSIEFGAPIPTDSHPAGAHEDPMLVFEQTDRVRDTIQQMLDRNVAARKGVFG